MTRERWSLRRWWRDLLVGNDGVAHEVDEYLSGAYLEHVLAGGGALRTAPWMWLNAPAHGSLTRVRELAAGEDPPETGELHWHDARVLVARQLVTRCGDDALLLTLLQSSALVPLELAVMGEHGTTPARLVAHALAELAGPGT